LPCALSSRGDVASQIDSTRRTGSTEGQQRDSRAPEDARADFAQQGPSKKTADACRRYPEAELAQLAADPPDRAFGYRLRENLRVPETRFGVSDGAWAGSSGAYLMRLLAV
jgi:hypothetical protein